MKRPLCGPLKYMDELRVIIADDERPAREYLKALLGELDAVSVVGEAENGPEALDLIINAKPDLALLDLQMPEMSGIEVVRALKKPQMPLVAFVTAYDQFAVQAFELNAVDYLLKPVERSRLRQTIERASERLEHTDWRESEAERMQYVGNTLDEGTRAQLLERIPVKKRDEILFIPVAEVASIVADGELLRITTAENQRFTINFRLKDLEARLDEKRFVRLSRSSLVNLDMISRVSPVPGGTYLISLNNGQELASSRLQSKILRTSLFKL